MGPIVAGGPMQELKSHPFLHSQTSHSHVQLMTVLTLCKNQRFYNYRIINHTDY